MPAPALPALPITLPYAVSVERDFVRARLLAALVTGPAGVLLLAASSGRLVLGALGVLCVLAGVGWLFAARGGSKRARDRGAWRLTLDEEALSVSTPTGERVVPREVIHALTLDDDRLQVVITVPGADELRLEATWGALGAVDLHALLLAWWRPDSAPSAHDN